MSFRFSSRCHDQSRRTLWCPESDSNLPVAALRHNVQPSRRAHPTHGRTHNRHPLGSPVLAIGARAGAPTFPVD